MNKYLKLGFWIKEKPIVLICILCFILRIIFCFFIFPIFGLPLIENVDIDQYGMLAKNMLHGHGYVREPGLEPEFLRTPLYPFFLFTIYSIFGESLLIVQFMHSLIGALTCYVIYLIAVRIFNRKTAIISAIIFSLYPLFIWYTARIWTETLLVFLVSILVLFLINFLKSPIPKNAFLIGLILGIINLCKSVLFLFFVFLLVVLLTVSLNRKKALLNLCLIFIVMSLTISPWLYRNFKVSNRFLYIQKFGVFVIAGDLAIEKDIGFKEYRTISLKEAQQAYNDVVHSEESKLGKRIDSLEQEKLVLKYLFCKYLSSPFFLLKKVLVNFVLFWFLGGDKWRSLMFFVMQSFLLIPAIFGVIHAIKNKLFILPLFLVVIYYVILHTVGICSARYSIPIMPYVGMFAAYAITVKLEKRYKI